ncbi:MULTISPECIES: DUF3097 domain-containing protein [Brevibacterium]|jgi:hypothetical protein|uniref:DUF3097 domain-containing protein n=1 Tax=Brevibacterium salitolerans TaxID=1403566 RepID=A0ABP5HZI4_9MICO|nr:DUF3097 domain-containing protein [Brevibacterium sp.]
MPHHDPYGRDVLSSGRTHARKQLPEVPARPGLVVEVTETGYVGEIIRIEKAAGGIAMILEDRRGRRAAFPLGPGYLVEGRACVLTRPAPRAQAPAKPERTASGSRAVAHAPARVARGSRIWVEGKHDAELVEAIWGDDLRIEGVVVEPLGGLDDLPEAIAEFGPDPEHRVGVLADHMVAGTKEMRLAESVMREPRWAGNVRVIGHPFVDVWQAVRPEVVGIRAWPQVPRGEDWKTGVLKRIGWPHADHRDTARAWVRILKSVRTIADVDPALSGRVEELIDFVTVNRH